MTGVFDSNVFDSNVFDTGAVAESGGGMSSSRSRELDRKDEHRRISKALLCIILAEC